MRLKHRGFAAIAWMIALLVSGCAPLGITAPATPISVTIQGQIAGQTFDAAAAKIGSGAVVADAAINCNDHRGKIAANGRYQVTVPSTALYHCAVSADGYQPQSVILQDTGAPSYQITFTAASGIPCAGLRAMGTTVCPALQLPRGTLQGRVTATSTQIGLEGIGVTCRDIVNAGALSLTATTNQQGEFSIPAASPGRYFCIPQSTSPVIPDQADLAPGKAAQFAPRICSTRCSDFTYHGGNIMHHYTAYLIFWLPPGYHYLATGADETYEALMQRYFADIGGSTAIGLLSQYWDTQGYLGRETHVGGVFRDTAPYQHCDLAGTRCSPASASASDPLSRTDIVAHIAQVVAAQHWTPTADTQFFLYLGAGAQGCMGVNSCSTGQGNYYLCAYHGWNTAIFGNIPLNFGLVFDPLTAPEICRAKIAQGRLPPNGDWTSDAAIAWTAHEQFEAITDPTGSAWYFSINADGTADEIADRCEFQFGIVAADGRNLTLNGHPYLLQEEWSNAANSCALQ